MITVVGSKKTTLVKLEKRKSYLKLWQFVISFDTNDFLMSL